MSGTSSGGEDKSNDHFAESTGSRSQPWKNFEKDANACNEEDEKRDLLVVQSGTESSSNPQDDVCKECTSGKPSKECDCVGFIAA